MKTTFGRTFLTAAAILFLALAVLGAVFQFLVRDYVTDKTVTQLQQDAQVIADLAAAYSIDGSLSSRDFLLNLDVASEISNADAVICDSSGRIIICSRALMGCEHQGMQVDREYLNKVVQNSGDVSKGLIPELYPDIRYLVSKPILNDSLTAYSGIVIVSSSVTASELEFQRISNLFLGSTVVVVFLAVLVVSLFARNQSRPLKDMARVANAFGHGNLDSRVKVEQHYSQEIEELAIAFNHMAAQLQKSEDQRQEFVANVSHELKTPMTTISGYIDGILDGTIPQERHRHYLQIVSDETKRLSRLVRSMLDISQLRERQGIPEEQKIHFDLCESAGQVLITFEQKILSKELEVEVDMPLHPVCTIANRDAVTQVLYNLIDNAVKFCPQGGHLGLTIREGRGKAYVSVSNDGDTIPPEELPLVFDRFHKLDKSRSQNRDGWGLGLYIVKTLIGSHGEHISVTSRDGKTTFTFTMPLVE